MNRPESSEYADFYANYISKVRGSDVLGVLESQRLQMLQLFTGRASGTEASGMRPEKWTVKEVLGHITDTERIFYLPGIAVRARRSNPLPGFEQDDYVRSAAFGERTLAGLAEEFGAVRSASIGLFRSFKEMSGRASGFGPIRRK